MNLTTRQIRAFLDVARAGSFTRAAERAHMTQAGLSILVRELERQLGARLFDRTTRSVTLTEAGQRFAQVARSVLQQLDDATAEVDVLGRQSRQQLRVAATPLVSSHLLPELLARFRDAHPDVRIRLLDGDLQGVQDMVGSGAADVGLGFFFKAAPGLVRTHVADFPLMKVSPSASQPQSLGRAGWTSLRAVPLIALPSHNPVQRAIEVQLHKLGIDGPTDPEMSVRFMATQIAMVEAGFGHAVMPTFAAAACRRHRVRMEVLGNPRIKLGFHRIVRRGGTETDAMRNFDVALKAHIPAMSR